MPGDDQSRTIERSELEACYCDANRPMLDWAHEIVSDHAELLAGDFYGTMNAIPEARKFLGNQVVEKNLPASMAQWLRDLFNARQIDDLDAFIRRQQFIGQVHARIGLPMRLVNRGMLALKKGIWRALIAAPEPPVDLVETLLLSDELLDLAVGLLNEAYLSDLVASERESQALRITMLGQNAALTFERMRVDLQRYLGQLMGSVIANGDGKTRHPSILNSSVGLWINHKARLLFADQPEIPRLLEQLERIEKLVDSLETAPSEQRPELVAETQAAVGEADWLLEELARSQQEDDKNRDPLTRVFNRRFLASIMKRETEFSINQQSGYSVLMVDIDHFKGINDEHGHETGDRVLHQVAETIAQTVRAGDYVFRYGGEEFLVLLTSIEPRNAVLVAGKIRAAIEETVVRPRDDLAVRVTASIGVAEHQGHPDYSQVIARADRALYEAKSQGRNCVVAG